MAAEPTLVERLQAVAGAAISDVGPTLEHELGRLQCLTIELELASGGQVVDRTVWTQRRASFGRRA